MKKRIYASIGAAAILVSFAFACLAWEADFEPSSFNPEVGEPVTFAICEPCLDSGTYRYAWDFDGDGVTDLETEEMVIEHVFETRGFHAVGLTSTAPDGRRKTKRLGILVGKVPAYAVRETIRELDGSIFVLITVYMQDAITAGVGFTENLPRGWMSEVVDVGGAIKGKGNDAEQLGIAWGSQFDAGAVAEFSYRLIPGYGNPTVAFEGMVNGYTNGDRFFGEVCGELEIAP